MRDQRKEELEELVEAGRLAAVRAARLASGKPMESEDESDGEEWTGVEDTPKPAPVPEVNHEEEYVDEDKFTLVTVEELDLNASDPESEDEEAVTARKAAEAAALLGPDGKEKKKWPKKEKKKKFRYLTKTERKTDRFKVSNLLCVLWRSLDLLTFA